HAPNGAQDSQMCPAAAEVSVQRRADLGLARPRLLLQQCRRRHDHAADAVTALGGLLGEERLLEGMETLARAQALQRRHGLADRGHRRDARLHGAVAAVDGARAALGEATSEPGTIERELVAKDVQERRVSGGGYPMSPAVDRDLERIRHGPELYVSRPPHARNERREPTDMDRGLRRSSEPHFEANR